MMPKIERLYRDLHDHRQDAVDVLAVALGVPPSYEALRVIRFFMRVAGWTFFIYCHLPRELIYFPPELGFGLCMAVMTENVRLIISHDE